MDRSEHGLSYLRSINETFYDQLKVADQKATLMMSLIILLVVWSPDVRQAFLRPAEFAVEPALAWAASLFVTGALLVSLASALFVVVPRRRPGGGPLFWGGWPGAREAALELARSGDADGIALSYADNAAHLAAICRRKYRFVSIALWSLIAAIGGHVCFMLTR